MQLIVSDSLNPYLNIAIERELMNSDEEVLFLWRNEPVVVFGRNQNPLAEINLEKAGAYKVHVARRYSGGGAVYQDFGNLNYSWITKEKSEEWLLKLIQNVLKPFGIRAEKSGRNDLLASGRKFSGTAHFTEEDTVLYHGTLMVEVDLNRLSEVLNPSKLKLQSKGIASVRSRVVNLKEINPDISIDALIDAFAKELQCIPHLPEITEEVKKRCDVLSGKEWIYGESPSYEIKEEVRTGTGLYQYEVYVIDGKIEDLNIYTDDLNPVDTSALKANYLHRMYHPGMFEEKSE